MSSLINLSKAVKINLAKVTNLTPRLQVCMADDVSGSAHGMHLSGVIQRLFDRLFAVAYEFDDNRVLDAFAFDSGVYELEPVVESMFGNYVKKYIIPNVQWGGTNYAPVAQAIIDHYYPNSIANQASAAVQDVAAQAKGFFGKLFGGKAAPAPTPAPVSTGGFKPQSAKVKLPDPAYVLFTTDGANFDESATLAIFEANKDKQIYWQMIGISEYGSSKFPFLEKLAGMYPNVGFYNAGAIDTVSDDELYSKLFTPKFVAWYEAARKVA